jgi:hypothetical protein
MRTMTMPRPDDRPHGRYLRQLALLLALVASLVAAGGVQAASPRPVHAWGSNTYGQTTVPADLTGVTAIAAGAGHTVALQAVGPANGIYRLTATHSGKVLDVAGVSTTDGARVHQWTGHGGANQQWQLERQPDGAYKLAATHSGKVLEVAGRGTTDGTPIAQWAWHGGPNQRWWIEPVGADTYRLVNVHSGKVLDVAGGSTADGTAVHQWT